MKKRLRVILVITLCFSMVSCGKGKISSDNSDAETEFYRKDFVSDSTKEEIGNVIPEWVTESERDMTPFYVVTGIDEQFAMEEFPKICDAYWTQEQSDAVFLGHGVAVFNLDGQENGNKMVFYPVILNGTIVSVLVVYLETDTMTLGWQLDPNNVNLLNDLRAHTSPDVPARIGYNRNNLIAVCGSDYYLIQGDFMMNEEVDISLIPPADMNKYVVADAMELFCGTRTADVSDWTVTKMIDSKYYQNALRARTTTDMLIGSVSQVALNHIGLLVVDEIQNVCNSKNGKSLVGMLTQLINNSGISICMVGTPESAVFFEQAVQLARRSLGLRYDVMEYGTHFRKFCEIVFSYQYVKIRTEITDGIMEWLYEHTSGNISVVVSLIHDAQEIAILNGKEVLNLESLNEAYQKRLSMLHGFIHVEQKKQTSKPKKKVPIASAGVKVPVREGDCGEVTIADLVSVAKDEDVDIVQLLKEHMTVMEVAV